MISVNIDVPEADLQRMNSTFARYVEHMRGDVRKAARGAAVKLVVALRASTVQSPKKRPIVQNPGYATDMAAKVMDITSERSSEQAAGISIHIQDWYRKNGTPNTRVPQRRPKAYWHLLTLAQKNHRYPWAAEKIKGTTAEYLVIKGAVKKSEANASPLRQIKRSGLARASWGWMLGRMGKSGSGDSQKKIEGLVIVNETNAGYDFEIHMSNRLSYIRDAVKGTVSGFVGRAAKMMQHEIERAIAARARRAGSP